MKNEKVFLIGGSHKIIMNWVNEHKLTKDSYIPITSVRDLRGYKPKDVILLHNWWLIDGMEDELDKLKANRPIIVRKLK